MSSVTYYRSQFTGGLKRITKFDNPEFIIKHGKTSVRRLFGDKR